MKKFVPVFVTLLFLATLLGIGYLAYSAYITKTEISKTKILIQNPSVAGDSVGIEQEDYLGITSIQPIDVNYSGITQKVGNPRDTSKTFNILVLGSDRRSADQRIIRTDAMQLITLSPDRTKAVVTHIPRDIWIGRSKINAIYSIEGIDSLRNRVYEVTGQYPDRYIKMTFDQYIWLIDSISGLYIDVPNPFIDEAFENDGQQNNDDELSGVYFEMGEQIMNGERALKYVRSRSGNNNEGSDFARGIRQQIVMRSFLENFFSSEHMFTPKTPQVVHQLGSSKTTTDISLEDTEVLLDLAKYFNEIETSYLNLSTDNFLEIPVERNEYLGAWVLLPKNGSYSPVHTEILKRITFGNQE